MAVAEVTDVDLLDPSLYRSGMPHALYADLREIGSVLWHPKTHVAAFGGDVEFWAILGHREVEQANRDWETFSAYDGTTIVPFPRERRGVMLVAKDPPEHLKLRKLISAGFTPRMIGRLEEQITDRTEQILDEAAARGEVDFVPEIAYQLPMHVIADIVGIPEADRPEVFALTEVIMRAAARSRESQQRSGTTRRSRCSATHTSSVRTSGRSRPTTCGRFSPRASWTSSNWTCSSWCSPLQAARRPEMRSARG